MRVVCAIVRESLRLSSTTYDTNATLSSIQFLRDVRDFLGVTFKIKEEQSDADSETKTLLLSCLGTAFVNVNRKAV